MKPNKAKIDVEQGDVIMTENILIHVGEKVRTDTHKVYFGGTEALEEKHLDWFSELEAKSIFFVLLKGCGHQY